MASKKTIAKVGLGVLVAAALAPKRGSESYEQLKAKLNDLYLQAKEIKMDDIKDNVENLRIELTKLDSTKSKEIVATQAEKIKVNLDELVDKLQNAEVKPHLGKAVDSLEKKALEAINYFEENDLSQKFSDGKESIVSKVDKYKEELKERTEGLKEKTEELKEKTEDLRGKAEELVDKTKEGYYDLADKVLAKKDEILAKGEKKVDFLEDEIDKRKAELDETYESKIEKDLEEDLTEEADSDFIANLQDDEGENK